jgi:hypothetical protein
VGELRTADVHELFLRLGDDDDDAAFLGGCTQEIAIVVRHGHTSVHLDRSDFGAWFEQQHRDSGATLCSAPIDVFVRGQHAVVIVAHALRRDGVNLQYQTINQCNFDDGRLARWTVSPVNLSEYAWAWNLSAFDQLLPA